MWELLHHVAPYYCTGRQEALRRWKSKQGLKATYGNLFELFLKAGHTQCVHVVSSVLLNRSH